MEDHLKFASNIYQACAYPNLTRADVSVTNTKTWRIEALFKQRNCVTKVMDEYAKIYDLKFCKNQNQYDFEELTSFPVLSESFELASISLDNKKAIIKKLHLEKSDQTKSYVLYIWSQSGVKKTINLSSYDKHGCIYTNATFGSLQWSVNGDKILYVAESKKKDSHSFFEKKNDDSIIGDKFNYQENWGEGLTNVILPVMCTVDVDKETVDPIHINDSFSPSQPQWGPNNSVIFEGIDNLPFKLGKLFCYNRPSKIFQLKLSSKELIELSTKDKLAENHHPRVSKDQSKVIFLSNSLSGKGDPHFNFSVLMIYNFVENKTSVAYDNNKEPLFVCDLSMDCWFSDNIHIVLFNQYEGCTYAYILDTDSGEMKGKVSCSQLFGVSNNLIISTNMKLDSLQDALQVTSFIDGKLLTSSASSLKDERITTGFIMDTNNIKSCFVVPGKGSNHYESKWPLIVYPHGGPHILHTDNFDHKVVSFCHLGYAVLLANYRGSSGFTKESLMSLPGNIGTEDVNDVHNFALRFIDMFPEKIDTQNIFLFGGSHGGFLGAHLVGQYPDFYRAAALRNPVIDVAAMVMVSDIPDWAYVECGISYIQKTVQTSGTYMQMIEHSPIRYIQNIKAPILLFIGGKDERVPPSQGKGFYRLLKAHEKTTKLLFYPDDCHPLSSVETDADLFMNTCKWFYNFRT